MTGGAHEQIGGGRGAAPAGPEQGRGARAKTKTLADALYGKAASAGITVEGVAEINTRVKALRDAFRAA